METTTAENWCSRQIPKGKIISKFAWQVVSALCVLSFGNAISAYQNNWWNLSFKENCDHQFHLVVIVRTGICYTDSAVGRAKFSTVIEKIRTVSECLPWKDTAIWENIDSVTGKNTRRDAAYKYPTVEVLLLTMIAISSLQVLICALSWRHPESMKGKFRQYLLSCLCVLFIFCSYFAGHVGSQTDVALVSTWDYYNDCTNNSSFPVSGFWSNVAAIIFNGVALFVLLYPSKFWCFHFISAQEQRYAHPDPNPDIKEIAMVELSHDHEHTVRYADIPAEDFTRRPDILTITSLNLTALEDRASDMNYPLYNVEAATKQDK